MEVYFRGEKFKIVDVYQPISTQVDDSVANQERAFRYEL